MSQKMFFVKFCNVRTFIKTLQVATSPECGISLPSCFESFEGGSCAEVIVTRKSINEINYNGINRFFESEMVDPTIDLFLFSCCAIQIN